MPSELSFCACEETCSCLKRHIYFQVSENGEYPESNCPPNPGNLPNGEWEVDDASFISDTPSSEEWLRTYYRGWVECTEEPRKHLDNDPAIIDKAHASTQAAAKP